MSMKTNAFRKNLFIVLLTLVAVVFITYEYYPQVWLVPWWRHEFAKHAGLSVVPAEHRSIDAKTCSNPTPGSNLTSLRIGNIELKLPIEDRRAIEDHGNSLYRVRFDNSKVLAIFGSMPTAEDASIPLPGSKKIDHWSTMLRQRGITSNYNFISTILSTTPNDLSFFQGVRSLLFNVSLLNLKTPKVPRDAHAGYSLIINDSVRGFQMGDGNDRVFVHIIDRSDRWYQLIFHLFTRKEMDCLLAAVSERH